jgi:hypothetical protein
MTNAKMLGQKTFCILTFKGCRFLRQGSCLHETIYATIKAPKALQVQVSDTTMMPQHTNASPKKTLPHFLHPFISIFWAKFPGGKIIFYVTKHTIPFLWGIAIFHN